MAMDLNKVMLTGRLGADPEMRYTPQGSAVTTFRVASNRSWKNAEGEQHQEAEWFRVVAWNKLAEICNQYLTKGSRVYIEGRLQTRQWQDQDGQTHYSTEVVADDMIMLDTRAAQSAQPSAEWGDDAPPAPRQAATVPQRRAATAAPAQRPTQRPAQRPAPRPTRDEDELEDLPF